jgi:hypothetical protein
MTAQATTAELGRPVPPGAATAPPADGRQPRLNPAANGRYVTLRARVTYAGSRMTDVDLCGLKLQIHNSLLLRALDPPLPGLTVLVKPEDEPLAAELMASDQGQNLPPALNAPVYAPDALLLAARCAQSAMAAMLTGVGVHNDRKLHTQEERDRFRIEGPVVEDLARAHQALCDVLRMVPQPAAPPSPGPHQLIEPAFKQLRSAANTLLTHREGTLPARGWLRDNDASRADLHKLERAVRAAFAWGDDLTTPPHAQTAEEYLRPPEPAPSPPAAAPEESSPPPRTLEQRVRAGLLADCMRGNPSYDPESARQWVNRVLGALRPHELLSHISRALQQEAADA